MNSSIIKFEKSTNYLTEQLNLQENNKQLLLDIVANIGIICDNNSSNENLEDLIDAANDFLSDISDNITTINELQLEISNITKELTDVLSDKNRNSKSKEYYIATFSTIKNNIVKFTEKYQNFQLKLEEIDDDLNEFINVNNFKYTYNTVNNSENDSEEKYEFAGFSVNDNELVHNSEDLKNDLTLLEFDNAELDIPSKSTKVAEESIENSDLIDDAKNIENIDLPEEIDESLFEDFLLDSISEDDIQNFEFEEKEKEPNSYSDLKKELNNIFNEINGIIIPEEENHASEDINVDDIDLDDIPIDDINLDDIPIDDINLDDIPMDDIDLNGISIDEVNTEELSDNSEINENQDITLQISDENSEIENNILDEYSLYNPLDEFEVDVLDTQPQEEAKLEDFEVLSEVEDINESEFDIDLDDNDIDSLFISENNERESDVTTKTISEVISNEPEEKQEDINSRIKKIISGTQDNNYLIISERTNCVFLPYTIEDLTKFIENYPEDYSSLSDVVDQEYILSFDYFMKHPVKSRFEETYNLLKNRNGKSPIYSLNYALKLVKMDNLNPAIIAACRTEKELETYLYLLSSNSTRKFKCFNIIYDINPL